MKAFLKGGGILLLICGLLLFFIASGLQEETKPQQITFGTVIDGNFSQTGSGLIGGNSKANKTMQTLKTLGIMSSIGGAVLYFTSFAFGEDS